MRPITNKIAQNIKSKFGMTTKEWAVLRGESPATVYKHIYGVMGHRKTEVFRRIWGKIAEDGLLGDGNEI